jgi:Fe-S cluster biogenesis protein NfuA
MYKVTGVEDTPNPDALKFVLDRPFLESGVKQFDSAREASKDPLAESLFALGGVESVFYMGSFVTVSKLPYRSWEDLRPAVIQTVEEKAGAVAPVAPVRTGGASPSAEDDALLKKIHMVLEENVVPALAADGGGLEVLDFNNYILTIHYQGACGSCPSSTSGTMAAVQNLLQRMIDPRIQVIPG